VPVWRPRWRWAWPWAQRSPRPWQRSRGTQFAAISLAIFSLLLAAVVSLTVVPRLFQRARREWLRFSIQIAREGWVFLFHPFDRCVAAFNTGNNLIFIILSAALGPLGSVRVSLVLEPATARRRNRSARLRSGSSTVRFSLQPCITRETGCPAFSCSLTCLLDRVLEPSTSSKQESQTAEVFSPSAYFPFLAGQRPFPEQSLATNAANGASTASIVWR
jgi:hypothetical protein